MNFVLALFVGWCVERAQMIMGADNYASVYNGFGTIEMVNRRTTKAPMAYRVLVPWMIALIERITKSFERTSKCYASEKRIVTYQTIKVLFNTCALWMVGKVWGLDVMLLVAVLLLLTFKFDYWDWAVELFAVAAGLSGNFGLAYIGAITAGLSRETAILGPLAYYLVTGDIISSVVLGMGALGMMGVVRYAVGKRPLYCQRFMFRENWKELKNLYKWVPVFHGEVLISVVVSVLALLAMVQFPPGWPIIPIVLVSGWMMGKADETRIFILTFPWIGEWLLRVLGA